MKIEIRLGVTDKHRGLSKDRFRINFIEDHHYGLYKDGDRISAVYNQHEWAFEYEPDWEGISKAATLFAEELKKIGVKEFSLVNATGSGNYSDPCGVPDFEMERFKETLERKLNS